MSKFAHALPPIGRPLIIVMEICAVRHRSRLASVLNSLASFWLDCICRPVLTTSCALSRPFSAVFNCSPCFVLMLGMFSLGG